MAQEPIETDISGPLFDGTATKVMDQFGEQASKDIAEFGLGLIRDDLVAHFRHGTGKYVSKVEVKVQGDNILITDNGVIYGPWLEGTSSRNQSTHFKGYGVFRRQLRVIQDQVVAISDRTAPPFLRKIS